jgi:hypothetical protein
MAQSTREYDVVSIHQANTDEAAAASRRTQRMVGPRAVLGTTGLARCLPSLRHQIAVTRTLLDELEDRVPPSPFLRASSAQVIEELRRLGSRVFDVAAVFAQHEEAVGEEHRRG